MNAKIYQPLVVQELKAFYGNVLFQYHDFPKIKDHLEFLAGKMFLGIQNKESVLFQVMNNYHKSYLGKPVKELLEMKFSMKDCLQTIANEYGFENWEAVESLKNTEYDIPFEESVNTMLEGDLQKLKRMIQVDPDLISRRSKYGHKATLLHYAGSNGVEFWRQIVPLNLPEITTYLLEAGVDKNATMKVYGSDFNVLALLETSAHPYEAGIAKEMIEILS